MAEDPDDAVFFRRDYSSLWQPPPPLPPRRLPWALLAVLAGVVLGAILFAVGD